MNSHSSIQVVRMWYGIHIDPVLSCFMDLEQPNYRDLIVGVIPELTSWLMI
jgi:hypothetical protein